MKTIFIANVDALHATKLVQNEYTRPLCPVPFCGNSIGRGVELAAKRDDAFGVPVHLHGQTRPGVDPRQPVRAPIMSKSRDQYKK